MAEPIVDRLEVVDVDEQNGEPFPRDDLVGDEIRKRASIQKTGERVDRGLATKRLAFAPHAMEGVSVALVAELDAQASAELGGALARGDVVVGSGRKAPRDELLAGGRVRRRLPLQD